jgi:arylsulfatase A-like enzyme
MNARLVLSLPVLLAFVAAPVSAAPTKPNVIVIVGDDMGYADIGVHGSKEIPTPHLDSLAVNGVRCTSGYVSGPYCSPTRAGLLTGRYQTRFGHEFNPGPPGIDDNDKKGLSLKETTLPDRMKAAGYATGMVGKWHLGSAPEFHPLKRGFGEFYGFLGGAHTYFPQNRAGLAGRSTGKGDDVYRGTESANEKEYLTDAFAREAVAFVDRHKAEPFFLYLTFNAVHSPMEATDKYLTRFAEIADPKRRAYCAMMSAMDDGIGRLLEKLDAEKLTENTLIFFISDNGGPTAANSGVNTPLRGFKATTFEGGIRVPFLVQWKGKIPGGRVYDHPVIQLDILPTALAAAGSPVGTDSKVEGVDLLPYLSGANDGQPHDGLYWRFGTQTAVRMGDWKLVTARNATRNTKQGVFHEQPTVGPALFNLKDDVGEQNDLAKANPEKVAELTAAWNKWNEGNVPPTWTHVERPSKPAATGGEAPAAPKAKKKAKKAS